MDTRTVATTEYTPKHAARTLVILFLIVLVLGGCFFGYAHWDTMGNSQGHVSSYQAVYGSNNVYLTLKPHDCDWTFAPLGNKGCYYKKVVTTDDGARLNRHVYVSWEKVDD
jgi:hypothetical protein